MKQKRKPRDPKQKALRARAVAVRQLPLPDSALRPLLVLLLERSSRRDREFAAALLDVIERMAAFEESPCRPIRDEVLRAWRTHAPSFERGTPDIVMDLERGIAYCSPEHRAGEALLELENFARQWDRGSAWRDRAAAVEMVTDIVANARPAVAGLHGRDETLVIVGTAWTMLRSFGSGVRPVSVYPPRDVWVALADRVLTAKTPSAAARAIVAAAAGAGAADDDPSWRTQIQRTAPRPPGFDFLPPDDVTS